MNDNIVRKGLIFGIILLFVGIIIVTSINGELKDNRMEPLINVISKNKSIEYWALLVGPWVYGEDYIFQNSSRFSAEKMYDALVSSENWHADHIKMITCENGTKNNIIRGLRWLDAMEDEDDVSVIYFATHGEQLSLFGIPLDFPPFDEADHCDEVLVTYWSFEYPFLTYLRDDELKFFVNQLESQGICIIIDSCYAGGFNDAPRNNSFRRNILPMRNKERCFSSADFIKGFSEEIKGDNRVIIMATEEDEVGWATNEGHDFTNVLIKAFGEDFGDFNNNGFISAEEVFNYTQPRLTDQHPTIYDGYNGELDIAVSKYELDLFYDCESVGEWTTIDHTGGTGGDLWHLTETDCTYISPSHCWCLGDENTMRYNNNMDNSLVSPEIKLGIDSVVSFYAKAEIDFYDSLLLDISADNWSSYSTNEVSVYYYNNWRQREINLGYSGKTVQIRFRVVTDESIPFKPRSGIGFFMIDEILIFSERVVR